MKRSTIFAVLLVSFFGFCSPHITAQSDITAGVQLQVYPTGLIPGVSGEILINEKSAVDFRFGVNIVRHGDAGVQDDERGSGLGLSQAYRYYFKSNTEKWYVGTRVDFWFNNIDWIADKGLPTEEDGRTNIVVFQPTAILGYKIPVNEWFVVTPEIALGAEINLSTDGREVGEGSIFLIGISGHFYL